MTGPLKTDYTVCIFLIIEDRMVPDKVDHTICKYNYEQLSYKCDVWLSIEI